MKKLFKTIIKNNLTIILEINFHCMTTPLAHMDMFRNHTNARTRLAHGLLAHALVYVSRHGLLARFVTSSPNSSNSCLQQAHMALKAFEHANRVYQVRARLKRVEEFRKCTKTFTCLRPRRNRIGRVPKTMTSQRRSVSIWKWHRRNQWT